MKRTALRRRTELKRTSFIGFLQPQEGTGPYRPPSLKRSGRLKPMSAKGRARRQEDAARVRDEGEAFHARIRGERCVVCGRTAQEAYEAGTRHQAHHGIRQEVLKRLGLRELLWDPENAVCACEEPCHRQHTGRQARIPAAALPTRVWAFAKKHGLILELEAEYPS